ncbi:REP-associated tyrosine transposase [Yoonia litorea]|uniref:Putative transposase n=1 Tax=Yoonia litorea TaxID=1123755 RepID=A0A1I6LEE0_9RHOB|nr:transposase [Yoonia litorea]SFS01841.1 putative transposase [Yoonia litorea]
MTQEQPLFVPGGTYLFTVRLQDAREDLLVKHIDVLRDATRLCRKRWPFGIPAAVILPNQLHMIWSLPEGDADIGKRWRLIKTGFSRHVPAPDYVQPSHARRGDKGIWQRGFWEHLIRNQQDFDRHTHVISTAPVQAGLVRRASDWPYSSLHHQRRRRVRTIGLAPLGPDQAVDVRSRQTALTGTSEMH